MEKDIKIKRKYHRAKTVINKNNNKNNKNISFF